MTKLFGKRSKEREHSRQVTKRKRSDVSKKRLRSSQNAIQYEALTDTGICVLGDNKYSVMLHLSDIDYQIAPQEHQENIVEQYARFLNTFSAGQSIQISVVNRVLSKEQLKRLAQVPPRGDNYDTFRHEINDLISTRLQSGRNNVSTDKYMTLTCEAESFEQAQTILSRMASEAVAGLRSVGECRAEVLNGLERARVLHRLLRPNTPFTFDFPQLIGSNLSTKDFLCPWMIDFTNPKRVLISSDHDTFYQVLCLRDLPNWLSDRLIKELSEVPIDMTISLHVRPIDQAEGLNMVKRQIVGMEMQKITEEKKADKQGYSRELIPHELVAAHQEAVNLRHQLEQSNEKLFRSTILIGIAGASEEELAENVERIRAVGRKHSCVLEDLRYMQEDAFNGILPLGQCRLPIHRTMTTAMVAILVPFTTQELLQEGGLFYGVNALSKNLILASRLSTMNGNAFVLGTSGSGKSQLSKFEAMSIFLSRPDDDIIIIDPEREYVAVGDVMGASRIEISATSQHCINPLHLDKSMGAELGSPIKLKAGFVLSLCEVLLGGVAGLSPIERSIIDRCATAIYTRYWTTPNIVPPTLYDLFIELQHQPEPDAHKLATGLELYASGSFSGFANQTNVDTSGRVVIYDISQLSADLKTFGMMIVLEQIWSQVALNRSRGKRTWLYIDEFHLLFSNDYSASYCQMLYKRARKWGLLPTGITQNIEELLASERARLMLANSDVLFLLNQQSTDADALQELFKWSDQQRSYFANVQAGCGMLKVGQTIVPFDNRMPTSYSLYKLFTTKFEEVAVK